MRDFAETISWFFSDDDVGRIISLILWSAISLSLLPCLVRCILKKPRYLDPLFSTALVLFFNRVAFGIQAYAKSDLMADFCRWSAIAGGLFYWYVITDYKRSDRV